MARGGGPASGVIPRGDGRPPAVFLAFSGRDNDSRNSTSCVLLDSILGEIIYHMAHMITLNQLWGEALQLYSPGGGG